jgi:signal peptidase II
LVARPRTQLALGLAAAVLLVDQLTKWLIVAVVMQPPRVIEITSFFNLVLVHNTGISLGMWSGESAWKPWVLSGLALAIVIGLLVWLRRQTRTLPALAIGLIVGGAIGNVIDRWHAPGVIDFLDFHAFGWHYWAFNVADSAITIGVAMLVFDGLFLEREKVK